MVMIITCFQIYDIGRCDMCNNHTTKKKKREKKEKSYIGIAFLYHWNKLVSEAEADSDELRYI